MKIYSKSAALALLGMLTMASTGLADEGAYDPKTPVQYTMIGLEFIDDEPTNVEMSYATQSELAKLWEDSDGSLGLKFSEGEGQLESWTIELSIKGMVFDEPGVFMGTRVSAGGITLASTETAADGSYGLFISTGDMFLKSEEITSLSNEDIVQLTFSYDHEKALASLYVNGNKDKTVTLDFSDAKRNGYTHIGTDEKGLSYEVPFDYELISGDVMSVMYGESSYIVCVQGMSVAPDSSSLIPEPTTGTLSLLALAGLCARRRRK